MTDSLTKSGRKLNRRKGSITLKAEGRRAVCICLAITLLNMLSLNAAQAAPISKARLYGELIAVGAVKVDGLKAVSGQTIFSGNSIRTAQTSSATVIFGRLARIELLPDTSARLGFDEASLTGMLDDGSICLSIPAGVRTSVTTKEATVVADDNQPGAFSINVEDGQTIVTTQTGRVYLQVDGEAREVAAGQSITVSSTGISANTHAQQSGNTQNSRGGKLAALLIGIGSAITIAAIVITGRDENKDESLDFGGCVVVSGEPCQQ
jgi:ferric-dicitrate binding protein FerR (iron transport regulator)